MRPTAKLRGFTIVGLRRETLDGGMASVFVQIPAAKSAEDASNQFRKAFPDVRMNASFDGCLMPVEGGENTYRVTTDGSIEDMSKEIAAIHQRSIDDALISACKRGLSEKRIEELLLAGASPYAQMPAMEQRLIQWVVELGKTTLCTTLISHGADPNFRVAGEMGQSLLCIAAGKAQDETIKVLVKAGAVDNILDRFNNNGLTAAAFGKHTDTAKLLLELDRDGSSLRHGGQRALQAFGQSDCSEGCLLLLEAGIRPENPDFAASLRIKAPKAFNVISSFMARLAAQEAVEDAPISSHKTPSI